MLNRFKLSALAVVLGCLVMVSACVAGVSGGSAVLFPKRMDSTVIAATRDDLWTVKLMPNASGAHYLKFQTIAGTNLMRAGIDGTVYPAWDTWNGSAWVNSYKLWTGTGEVDFLNWPRVAGTKMSESGSATLTVNGCTGSPTAAARFRRVGVMVVAVIDGAVSCTSGNALLYLQTIPVGFRPTAAQRLPLVECTDNGVAVNDCAVNISGSIIYFERAGGFTASGTKGIPAGLVLHWSTEF